MPTVGIGRLLQLLRFFDRLNLRLPLPLLSLLDHALADGDCDADWAANGRQGNSAILDDGADRIIHVLRLLSMLLHIGLFLLIRYEPFFFCVTLFNFCWITAKLLRDLCYEFAILCEGPPAVEQVGLRGEIVEGYAGVRPLTRLYYLNRYEKLEEEESR